MKNLIAISYSICRILEHVAELTRCSAYLRRLNSLSHPFWYPFLYNFHHHISLSLLVLSFDLIPQSLDDVVYLIHIAGIDTAKVPSSGLHLLSKSIHRRLHVSHR